MILFLLLIALVNSVSFYILVNREIPLKESFRMVCVAKALNKFFFSGTGYIASSLISRDNQVRFGRALSAFVLYEVISVGAWLFLGLYFGAKMAFQLPLIVFPLVILFLLLALRKRNRFVKAVREVFSYFKDMGPRIILVIPFIFLHLSLALGYYYFLFRMFNFTLLPAGILKLVAVSFTVGYLSPAPAGLGFKETGMVALLVEQGAFLPAAVSCALTDRVVATLFWAGLGALTGYEVIKEELIKRFRKPSSPNV